jgi:thiamine pyrophosphate-dependent acetolactate synthase large subunit-like protein
MMKSRRAMHPEPSDDAATQCAKSEVAFGPVDTVKYAGAFGATGLMIRSPDEIAPVLKRAFEIERPVLIGVHADYRDNHVRLCVQKQHSRCTIILLPIR